MQRDQRSWFYYSGESQVGPLTLSEILRARSMGLVREEDYVYRQGFADWKFWKDVPELAAPPAGGEEVSAAGRAPRAELREAVIAHNDQILVSGVIRNISASGVFFETQKTGFLLHDEVKLTLKDGKGLGRPLHLAGIVVRLEQGTGYGVELRGVDEKILSRIRDYVSKHAA